MRGTNYRMRGTNYRMSKGTNYRLLVDKLPHAGDKLPDPEAGQTTRTECERQTVRVPVQPVKATI